MLGPLRVEGTARREIPSPGGPNAAGRSSVYLDRMTERDTSELLGFLRTCVETSRKTSTEIEEACGLGHGRLKALLAGTLELRVRHLLGLARLLGVPPADFFALGCPSAQKAAVHPLAEYLGPAQRRKLAATVAAEASTELRELVRAVVREELGRKR